MRRPWIAMAALTLFLASAAPGMAATATRVGSCDKYNDCADRLHFSADPGETNVVSVETAQDAVVIRDVAGVEAGTGCVQVDERAVSCAPTGLSPYLAARFDLRDRDDVLDARDMPAWTRINGGRGDDRLSGPLAAFAEFTGGFGDDRMAGGSHYDIFYEGRQANGSDTMLGGRGTANEVSYAGRRRGVHVDADSDRDDGEPGERDRVVSVRAVSGGRGNDALIGGRGDDDLNGGSGRDVLRGGRGDDWLEGGDPRRWVSGSGPLPATGDTIFGGPGEDRIENGLGRDTVNAGPGRDWIGTGAGADRIATRDGELDVLFCGGGSRDAAVHDRLDFVESCERHGALRKFAIPLVWADASEFVSLLLGCPPRATPCEGRIVVKSEGTVLGETPFSQPADSHGFVYVGTPGRSVPLENGTVTVVSTTSSGESSEDFQLSDVCHGSSCFLGAAVPSGALSRAPP